ncbi:MAG: energy-coupling factor ABC transporter permease [Actinobacteria bacterium]|nr:energy-coupling factor ABC transporter permease [Actinomycetota bacterium]
MHIEDGILPPEAWGTWYGIAVLFVLPGLREIRRRTREALSYKPLLAMVGVAVFVISAMHLPVPVTGSCSHPVGTPLAAIIVGPFATVVITTIVLFFQAIFLGHGGITTIGANTFSMGIVGGIGGYLCWKMMRSFRSPIWLAAGLAGLAGDLLTYVTSAFELAWSLHGNVSLFHQWLVFFMGYGPTQIPLAIGEAVFSAAVLQVMFNRRPDLLYRIKLAREAKVNVAGI